MGTRIGSFFLPAGACFCHPPAVASLARDPKASAVFMGYDVWGYIKDISPYQVPGIFYYGVPSQKNNSNCEVVFVLESYRRRFQIYQASRL